LIKELMWAWFEVKFSKLRARINPMSTVRNAAKFAKTAITSIADLRAALEVIRMAVTESLPDKLEGIEKKVRAGKAGRREANDLRDEVKALRRLGKTLSGMHKITDKLEGN